MPLITSRVLTNTRNCSGFAALLLSIALTACGGADGTGSLGAGSSSAGTAHLASGRTVSVAQDGSSPQASTGTLKIAANVQQTSISGAVVTFSVSGAEDPTATQWSLAPDSPGSLSNTTGSTTQYVPPANGTAIGSGIVTVLATNGNATGSINISLSSSDTTSSGTQGATTTTPTSPQENTQTSSAQLVLLAGNDYGEGFADGTGSKARFAIPKGMARDARGNLYVADQYNYVVRKIAPDGTVSTLAGLPGAHGHADGKGTQARFAAPSGVAVDRDGNVYVSDTQDATVRRITPDGDVTTVLGAATPEGLPAPGGPGTIGLTRPAGMAFDDAGNLYVADAHTVRKVLPDGSVTVLAGRAGVTEIQDGPALQASFLSLEGLALDAAGNVYVVDSGVVLLNRFTNTFLQAAAVRKIGTDGMVTTIAGATGTSLPDVMGYADGVGTAARFSFPEGLGIDDAGNLYIADRGNHVIRKLSPDGKVTTVAGTPKVAGSEDGDASTARFNSPAAVVPATDGSLYVSESANHTIRRVVPGDGVTTVAGAAPRSGSSDGTRTSALFNGPLGLARDVSGTLYVADTGNQTIRRIGTDGMVTTWAGAAGQSGNANGPGSIARFNGASDVATDKKGNVFVADTFNSLVRRIDKDDVVSTFAEIGDPSAIATDHHGNVYVLNQYEQSVEKITPEGEVSVYIQPNTALVPVGSPFTNGLSQARDIALDKAGNLYVIDAVSAIRKYAPDGTMTLLAGAPFEIGVQDGTGTAARFNYPQSLTVDKDGNVYVADLRAIRKVTPDGVVTTVAGAIPNAGTTSLLNIHRPTRLVMTGRNTLAFTAGNGVFELRLP